MKKARLENWFIGENDLIVGQVYGHPFFEDGQFVTTSRVVRFDKQTMQAITMNTEYILGKEMLKIPENYNQNKYCKEQKN